MLEFLSVTILGFLELFHAAVNTLFKESHPLAWRQANMHLFIVIVLFVTHAAHFPVTFMPGATSALGGRRDHGAEGFPFRCRRALKRLPDRREPCKQAVNGFGHDADRGRNNSPGRAPT